MVVGDWSGDGRAKVAVVRPDAYGLDSRNAVQISGALEKIVDRRLSPAMLFDYSTIDDLSDHLASELQLPR